MFVIIATIALFSFLLQSRVDVYGSHCPAGTSVQNMLHWSQVRTQGCSWVHTESAFEGTVYSRQLLSANPVQELICLSSPESLLWLPLSSSEGIVRPSLVHQFPVALGFLCVGRVIEHTTALSSSPSTARLSQVQMAARPGPTGVPWEC